MKGPFRVLQHLFRFYADGFRNMSGWGKKVWLIIIIKLFIIFAVLRLFFFPDFLNKRFDNNSDKGDYIRDQIINYQEYND
jgi:hypothetical protein